MWAEPVRVLKAAQLAETWSVGGMDDELQLSILAPPAAAWPPAAESWNEVGLKALCICQPCMHQQRFQIDVARDAAAANRIARRMEVPTLAAVSMERSKTAELGLKALSKHCSTVSCDASQHSSSSQKAEGRSTLVK
jgi:hypothetical protein